MALLRLEIGVIVERRRLKSVWAEEAWQPVAVLPGAPAAPPWTLLHEERDHARFYAGALPLELHRTDTANYRDNLLSGRPALWVALRPGTGGPRPALLTVTADPAEGEALTEAGGDIVEPVPMPAGIAALVADFVARHHVERSFHKRRRDAADPEALARRPGGRPAVGEEDD